MAAFDAPQREYCVVRRSRTNTPLQALTMLNHRFTFDMANAFAERLRISAARRASATADTIAPA